MLLDPLPPVTNCRTSDPLERDVLYGLPLRGLGSRDFKFVTYMPFATLSIIRCLYLEETWCFVQYKILHLKPSFV